MKYKYTIETQDGDVYEIDSAKDDMSTSELAFIIGIDVLSITSADVEVI